MTRRMQNQAKPAAGAHQGHESRNYPAPMVCVAYREVDRSCISGLGTPPFLTLWSTPSRSAKKKHIEQVPALICDSHARRILCATAI